MADLLKLPEVAQRLNVSEKTVRRYVKAGVLPSSFIGNAYRVSEEDVEEYLRRARVEIGGDSPKESTLSRTPSTKSETETGEPIDYRERYFELGRKRFAIVDEALKNAEESLGTEDYAEFIKFPAHEQHWRIEWAERWRKMAEEILASIEDERVELASEQHDELAKRREALATTIETFRKTA